MPGSALVVFGAFAFAGSNVLAKALYRRGMTEVTLMLLRALSVYALNGLVVWASGGAPSPVLRLRDPAPALLLLRARACGFALLMLLNVSYDRFLTLADAFALFLGVHRACSSRSLSLWVALAGI